MTEIHHVNFQLKRTPPQSHKRAILFLTNQRTYDAMMNAVLRGEFPDIQKLIQAAIEEKLGLEPGSADPMIK